MTRRDSPRGRRGTNRGRGQRPPIERPNTMPDPKAQRRATALRDQARQLLDQADAIDADQQYTRDDLKTMTPEQIVEARAAGQLRDLLTRPAQREDN